MNLDTLEKLADAAIVEVEPGIYYSRPEAYDEYLDHCSPQTIKSLIALCKQLNVLIYDAIESGDDDPLREALAAYDNFNKGE